MRHASKAVMLKRSEAPEKMKEVIFDELRRDFADWLMAKEDLVWRPLIELTEEGDEFAVRALIPGVEASEVEVLVAPDILLIKGETRGRKILRSIDFPRPVDTSRVHAEVNDGMIWIKAGIAGVRRSRLARIA